MKSKRLTMETVARKAGVSITTVSHVINKTRHVNQTTKEAVLKAIEELHYRSAKENRKTEDLCIGVVLADAREDYYVGMVKALESAAEDYGLSLIFCDSEADYEKEEKNIRLLLGRRVHGLLLAPANSERRPAQLETLAIPTVLFDRQYKNHTLLFVGINNFRSGYLGTRYLIDKGANRIGCIGYSDPVDTVQQRILGYRAAVMESQLTASAKVLYLKYNGGDSFPLITQFIRESNFDGFICATSTLCYELIVVLDLLEPEALKKIITFDDNRWFDYLKYPVSVISQPVAEIGNAALENLLHLIHQPKPSDEVKRELLFEVDIIDRIK
jgi:LacI family transcriptional regulator